MAYDLTKKWVDIEAPAEQYARTLTKILNDAEEAYQQWITYRAGRDNATIASSLGAQVTEAAIEDLDDCYTAFKDLHDFADNVASPTQGDRFYAMRLFI